MTFSLPLFHQVIAPLAINNGNGFFYQPRLLANSDSFTLLDSGGGRKLERVAGRTFIRPEPQALWAPADQTPEQQLWQSAMAEFASGSEEEGLGRWQIYHNQTESWRVEHFGVPLKARLTPFRHYGFFPEQALLWPEMLQMISTMRQQDEGARPRVLNLFAYSGMASLLLANQGAVVTHVDASKKAIAYAEENISRDKGVRLLIDDAMTFVAREVRRKNTYDIILLDPPQFGRGPKGEAWDIWRDLADLLDQVSLLVSDQQQSAVFLTCYAIRASCSAIGQALADGMGRGQRAVVSKHGARVTYGELSLVEQGRGFLLPQALYAIWSKQPVIIAPAIRGQRGQA